MSDMLFNVPGTPWKDLGTVYKNPVTSSAQIIEQAKLNWNTTYYPMSTEISDKVLGYHTLYREDTQDIIGVVNSKFPQIVQNVDTFKIMEPLLEQNLISVDSCANIHNNLMIIGCFKMNEVYKVIDDDTDHYLVVVNDHLKPDGKVTILNTPVRVVCQNALAHALSQSIYKVRVPIVDDKYSNDSIATNVANSVLSAIQQLNVKAEKMLAKKISDTAMEKVLDNIFPYVDTVGGNADAIYSKANESVEMMRNTFMSECIDADNLANYKGTAYGVYNALTDYTQHYFKSADKGYNLTYKMSLLPGIGSSSESESIKVIKFLKMLNSIAA